MFPDEVEHFSKVTDGLFVCCEDRQICGACEVWCVKMDVVNEPLGFVQYCDADIQRSAIVADFGDCR